jgi:hypothetical protein
MLKFIKKFLKDSKGAMDKLVVTLLLVVFAIGAAVLLQSWMTDTINSTKNSAGNQISNSIGS